MKIIQVSSYYPPHLGGQENVAKGLAQHLAEAGHDVYVLTSTKGNGKKGLSEEQGVKVWRMVGPEFGHAPIMPAFAPVLFRNAPPGSIVHVHVGQAFVPELVWLVAKLRGFRYIAELHIDFKPSGSAGVLLPLYKRFVLGRVLRSAAAVIVLNKRTLCAVQSKYGVHKAAIMSNGIDDAYFSIKRRAVPAQAPRRLRLLFVGRLTKQKNVSMLLEAMAAHAKPNISLDIVGDGEERDHLTAMIADLGLTNVTMHGRLDRQAVLPFYQKCDALVVPSLYEAQPLVLLEAMAARLPIIGTNVIGVAEHIWGIGIVVEPTAQALADGFETLRNSYDALPAMLDRGFAKAQKLRWRNVGKEYESLYEEVLTA